MNLNDLFVTYNPINLGIEEPTQIKEQLTDESNNKWLSFVNMLQNVKFKPTPITKEDSKEQDYLTTIINPKSENLELPMIPQVEPFSLENPVYKENNYTNYNIEEIKNKNKVRYTDFQNKFNKWSKNKNITKGERQFLESFAALESGYNQGAKSKYSSASGWFQLLSDKWGDLTQEQFLKNPDVQFDKTLEHYRWCINYLKRNVSPEDIKNSKLTPLQIMYGMWWRPQSMKNYLITGKDEYVSPDGMDIYKILNKAK